MNNNETPSDAKSDFRYEVIIVKLLLWLPSKVVLGIPKEFRCYSQEKKKHFNPQTLIFNLAPYNL